MRNFSHMGKCKKLLVIFLVLFRISGTCVVRLDLTIRSALAGASPHTSFSSTSLMQELSFVRRSHTTDADVVADADVTPTKGPPKEIAKSSPTTKIDDAIDVNIEKEKVQALHMDSNILAGNKLYYGKSLFQWALLTIASMMLLLGSCSGTLLGRLYFVHGGSRRWLYTWLESAGWPINLVPLCICYVYKKRSSGDEDIRLFPGIGLTSTNIKLFIIYIAMGILLVIDNLAFAWGLSFLPASTSALLLSSQIAFNALFSYLLVGHKMTPSVLNSVFAMTIAAVLLGLHADTDRPPTRTQYIVGFILIVASAALYALILTLTEVIYKKVLKTASSVVAMEVQTMIGAVATVTAMLGMWAAGDFQAMAKESESFDLGRAAYALTLVGSMAAWEIFFLGAAAVVLLGSSLFTCVLIMAAIPMASFLSVIVFGDAFSALKAISMLLSMWGFVSYIYGGYSATKA